MKRLLTLVLVIVLAVSAVSCDSKKSKKKTAEPEKAETVSQDISAEEGGKVESSDGKTSIEIPGGALESDTTITMTIYNAAAFPSKEGEQVISKVVEFGPDGTVFKKPVIISMVSEEKIENKIITAAIYHKDSGEWSYSEDVAVKFSGYTETGDPIMMTATGDPIMLNATGDPIMLSATGDPIMLAATGDPIMMSATGDPIMMTATGDPIMMTTGHFSSYTFMAVDKKPADDSDSETDDDETTDADNDDNTDTGTEEDDTDTETNDGDTETETDDDTDTGEQEPEFSNVPCTGLRTCFGHDGVLAECPKQNEELGGQDAGYIFRKSCLPKSFERIAKADDDVTPYQQTKDNNTGLTWIFTGESGVYADVAQYCGDTLATYADGGWRLPTPAELLTIADHDIYHELLTIKEAAFSEIAGYCEGCDSFWADGGKFYLDLEHGSISINKKSTVRGLLCVKGDEYGKVAASDYVTVPENGEEMIRDAKTNLYWQKTAVGGKTWPQALKHCEDLNYAGHDDWRLPNKNELASLVDFTKENPASSFPGMPSEEFVSSTFTLVDGEVTVDMKTGETLKFQEIQQKKKNLRGVDSGKTFSVICVRSDITAYPENGIPECGADGYAPCKSGDVVWSARQYFQSYIESLPWQDVVRACREMPGGKWRIPNIDEIRTVFTDDSYKPGGTCGVTNEHPAPQYNDEACLSYNQAFETKLGDTGMIISGTILNPNDSRDDWSVWMIDTNVSGGLGEMLSAYGPAVVARCVLDNSLDDPKTFPYTDTANELVWSSLSERLSGWKEVTEYCGTLVEGGSDNWRVPTLEELEKIRINYSEGGYNAPRLDGYYSIFADIPHLWSSTVVDATLVKTIDFIDAATLTVETGDYPGLQAHCVRSTGDPVENPNHFDEEADFPYGIEVLWSKKSEEVMTNIDEAKAYCTGLNEAEYGYGYADGMYWQLPSVYLYLDLLISEDSNCSGSCAEYLELSEDDVQSCACNEYTFQSHSILNDFGLFWTSDANEDVPYLFDFTTGEVVGGWSYYNEAYVRCVADLRE